MNSKEQSIEFVSIDRLKFDPQNPRLPSTIDKNDEQAVIEWMLGDATITELMGAIGKIGYFPGEPLLVVPVDGEQGVFEVVEGNRRLTAVQLLHNPEFAPKRKKAVKLISETAKEKPNKLPVLEFKKRAEILDYLGYRHITAIKEWEPLAKARYLKQLYERSSHTDIRDKFQELAKTIGSRSDYVARLLTGLAVYDEIAENDFFGIKNLDEESISFSLLTTALSYNNIVDFLDLKDAKNPNIEGYNRNNLQDLATWLFEKYKENKTRLGESRNLKWLDQIVKDKKALEYFKDGSPLEDALRLTEAPTQIFQQAIRKAKEELHIALKNIHLVENTMNSDKEVLNEIKKIADTMRTVLREKLIELETD